MCYIFARGAKGGSVMRRFDVDSDDELREELKETKQYKYASLAKAQRDARFYDEHIQNIRNELKARDKSRRK